jgi:hypothetical protein
MVFPVLQMTTYMIVLLSTIFCVLKMYGRFVCFAIGTSLYNFCRALDSASFQKKIKILSSTYAKVYAKQNVCKHFATSDNNKKSISQINRDLRPYSLRLFPVDTTSICAQYLSSNTFYHLGRSPR